MGLLDELVGGMLGGSRPGNTRGGGMSPLVMALLALLASRGGGGLSGGLGDLLGGGRRPPRDAMPDEPGNSPGGLGDILGQILGGAGGGKLPGGLGDILGGGTGRVPRTAGAPAGSGSSGDGSLDAVLDDVFGKKGAQAPAMQAGNDGDDRASYGALGDLLGGGLGGLLETFQQSGRGDIARSWIGKGENAPVSADDLRQALPDGIIEQLAAMTGRNPDNLLVELTDALPRDVDRLTPAGRVPDRGEWV